MQYLPWIILCGICSKHVSIHLSTHPKIYLSINLSIYSSNSLSIHLNTLCISIYQSKYLYHIIHIWVPNGWYIWKCHLSCRAVQRYHLIGTQIWMAWYLYIVYNKPNKSIYFSFRESNPGAFCTSSTICLLF